MEKTIFLIILTCLALLPAGCLGHEPKGRLETGNNLSPCPDSPNCVSTQSDENAMTPLPYLGTKKKSHENLIRILQSMKGCTITKDEPGHVQAEFRSALFGFVDDVTFIFDDDARLIHFRSASRTGYYDFGVNRKRMAEISKMYRKDL